MLFIATPPTRRLCYRMSPALLNIAVHSLLLPVGRPRPPWHAPASAPRSGIALALQWQSALGAADGDWRSALSSTLANLTSAEDEQPAPVSLALLCVSQAHASHLREACSEVIQALSPEVLVGVVGAGVAGAGREAEGEPVFSLLAGELPEGTSLRPFLWTGDSMPSWPSLAEDVPSGSRPAFVLFADPFSPIQQAVSCLDDAYPASVVAGGLSCPTSESAPSLALYTRGALPRVLPTGSMLGLVLGGPRLEVHTACAQGASPVGPTFTVTAGRDNLVQDLDGAPALERLQGVAQEASADARLLRLLQRALLVGVPVRADDGVDGASEERSNRPTTNSQSRGPRASGSRLESRASTCCSADFLIRQVMGATPSGGLLVGDRIVPGETQLRFFVRDEIASGADLKLVLDRCARRTRRATRPAPLRPPPLYCSRPPLLSRMHNRPRHPPHQLPPPSPTPRADRVARQFSGRFPSTSAAAEPFATFLFSCNGRGRNMYSAADHDTRQFAESIADGALGGFFCNGEIGPAGVRLPAPSGDGEPAPFRTHLHGFTSVFAMLYEMPE